MRVIPQALLILALTALARPARAEGPAGAAERANDVEWRTWSEAGLSAFEAGKWNEAYDFFARAEHALHVPTVALHMAHCLRMMGRLVLARSIYQQVVDEKLAPRSPVQWKTAQLMAHEEAEHLKRRIPRLKIALQGSAASRAVVRIDGAHVAATGGPIQDFDAGDHDVVVTAAGAAQQTKTVTLKEWTESNLDFTLDEAPPATATVRETPAEPPAKALPPPPPKPKPRRLLMPAVVAFGGGAVGLGAGAVTGLLALSKASELRCNAAKQCAPADQTKASVAGTLADASTAGFVIGATSAATGAVLLVLHAVGLPGAGVSTNSASIGLDIGPTFLGARGTFR